MLPLSFFDEMVKIAALTDTPTNTGFDGRRLRPAGGTTVVEQTKPLGEFKKQQPGGVRAVAVPSISAKVKSFV